MDDCFAQVYDYFAHCKVEGRVDGSTLPRKSCGWTVNTIRPRTLLLSGINLLNLACRILTSVRATRPLGLSSRLLSGIRQFLCMVFMLAIFLHKLLCLKVYEYEKNCIMWLLGKFFRQPCIEYTCKVSFSQGGAKALQLFDQFNTENLWIELTAHWYHYEGPEMSGWASSWSESRYPA